MRVPPHLKVFDITITRSLRMRESLRQIKRVAFPPHYDNSFIAHARMKISHQLINRHDMTEKLELDKHLNHHYSTLLEKLVRRDQSIDLNYFRMRKTETGKYRLLKCASAYCTDRNHSSNIQCISFIFLKGTKVAFD